MDFAEDTASYTEDESRSDMDSSMYRNTQLWVSEDDFIAIGLTGEYLLVGDRENTVTRMVRRIESPPERSLAEDPDFIEAQESLPRERVMFMFAQTEDLRDFLDESVGLVDARNALGSMADSIPDYVAASASFINRGMSLDIVSDFPASTSNFSFESGITSPHALPSDALFSIAGTGVTDAWREGRDSLRDADSELLDAVDDALDDLEGETDIDLQEDIIDALSGEIALALLPSDISIDHDGTPSGAIEVLALAGITDRKRIADALDSTIDNIGGLNGNNPSDVWTTVTKVVVPGIPTDEGTQISLQRAFKLAYSQRILDLDGNPIPQSLRHA